MEIRQRYFISNPFTAVCPGCCTVHHHSGTAQWSPTQSQATTTTTTTTTTAVLLNVGNLKQPELDAVLQQLGQLSVSPWHFPGCHLFAMKAPLKIFKG